jgi:hypothetical protein
MHSQAGRDLTGQRFKTFKPFNRCAPFKPLNGLGSKCSNGSSSSRRFAPFSSAGLEHPGTLGTIQFFESLKRSSIA